jgi:hypothetical protein
MEFVIWLFAGVVLVAPLLLYANRQTLGENQRIFGKGLLIAASIYVAFAVIDANVFWLKVEILGVAAFSIFYWLSTKYSINWLALGWALHPAWDGIIHIAGPGAQIAPFWYAVACIPFDLAIAGYLSIRFSEQLAS